MEVVQQMAIYDRPVRLLMREMIAALAPEPRKVFTREQAIEWFARQYPKIKRGTTVAHLVRFSTNSPTRLHYNPRPDEELLFQIDSRKFRLYDEATDPPPIRSKDDIVDGRRPVAVDDEVVESASLSEFAYESDLRDFLAKDLSILEPGLRLYEDEGITGVEFPVGGRFVDILGVASDGRLVVIELKVSSAYDRVVGQLLRYVGWIEKNLAEPGQGVRGVIIAREISEDLQLACSMIPGVDLMEYELSVSVRKIEG